MLNFIGWDRIKEWIRLKKKQPTSNQAELRSDISTLCFTVQMVHSFDRHSLDAKHWTSGPVGHRKKHLGS